VVPQAIEPVQGLRRRQVTRDVRGSARRRRHEDALHAHDVGGGQGYDAADPDAGAHDARRAGRDGELDHGRLVAAGVHPGRRAEADRQRAAATRPAEAAQGGADGRRTRSRTGAEMRGDDDARERRAHQAGRS
jgi:hypothetical protein